jgi:hypothetical protein
VVLGCEWTQKQSSAVKLSQEVQAQLATVQEELKKAKEQLAEKEKEKSKALHELDRRCQAAG